MAHSAFVIVPSLHHCPPGYFCPEGTSGLSTTNACASPTSYCPEGSGASLTVDMGFYSVAGPAGLFVNQTRCPSGSFCAIGVRSLCPAGRFGAQAGETSPVCTGDCTQGHYCPAGSTVPTQEPCGTPTMYCPAVRAHVLLVGTLVTALVDWRHWPLVLSFTLSITALRRGMCRARMCV